MSTTSTPFRLFFRSFQSFSLSLSMSYVVVWSSEAYIFSLEFPPLLPTSPILWPCVWEACHWSWISCEIPFFSPVSSEMNPKPHINNIKRLHTLSHIWDVDICWEDVDVKTFNRFGSMAIYHGIMCAVYWLCVFNFFEMLGKSFVKLSFPVFYLFFCLGKKKTIPNIETQSVNKQTIYLHSIVSPS